MPANKIGKEFERQVANDIKAAFRYLDVTNQDCFRTPMSGGHHALPGVDIQLSPKLFKVFPYAIECKNDKRFRFGQWMNPTGNLMDWIKQVMASSKDIQGSIPLLVTNEKHIGVFCAIPGRFVPDGLVDAASAVLSCSVRGKAWVIFHWKEFLEFEAERARKTK